MAQTSHHMTSQDLEIHVSTDAGEWTDISGSSAAWSTDGGERETGTEYTAGSVDPLIGVGPMSPGTGTLRFIYTEAANEATDIINGYAENGTRVYLRARPRGSTVGYWQWTSRGHFLKRVTPAVDASSGDILTCEVPWFGTPWADTVQVS